eukprot:UN0968
MVRFVRRLVEQDLQGKVMDEVQLTICAASVFSRGVPKLTYQQLRNGLRDAKWVTAAKDELAPGSLVLVSGEEGNRRARVEKVLNSGDVTVRYDDGPQHSVRSFNVMPRPQMPSVPTWIIPSDVGNSIRSLELQIRDTKQALLRPMERATKVLTWKWPCVSFTLTMALLAVSAAEATILVGLWGDVPGAVGSRIVRVAGIAMDIVKLVFNTALLALAVLLLVHWSPVIVVARSITRICASTSDHAPEGAAELGLFPRDQRAEGGA